MAREKRFLQRGFSITPEQLKNLEKVKDLFGSRDLSEALRHLLEISFNLIKTGGKSNDKVN